MCSPEGMHVDDLTEQLRGLLTPHVREMDKNNDQRVSLLELKTFFQSPAFVDPLHTGPLRPSIRQYVLVALRAGVPFIAFGFMDLSIMLVCGDAIDTYFGAIFHLTAMAACATGALFSNVVGLGATG